RDGDDGILSARDVGDDAEVSDRPITAAERAGGVGERLALEAGERGRNLRAEGALRLGDCRLSEAGDVVRRGSAAADANDTENQDCEGVVGIHGVIVAISEKRSPVSGETPLLRGSSG